MRRAVGGECVAGGLEVSQRGFVAGDAHKQINTPRAQL
jgi:hypothetical protein